MAREIRPPDPISIPRQMPCVFLAGSIEMGLASNWQSALVQRLDAADLVILNPRRDAWDTSWVQSIDNAQFREQVEWELAGLEAASLVAMYFDPATKAPVTLLELGLCARSNKLIVCCPSGFWRRGNVEVVCARYGVPLVNTLDELAEQVWSRFGN
jgi:hypothetical protein